METPDLSAFGQYVPGFEFLQNLTRQAAGGLSGGLPQLSHWVAPTFDVEELDKRIQDLRAVHFWLDQNTKALGATIQALEVQKMTLSTLKGMNVRMQDLADAFKPKPTPEAAAPVASPPPSPWAAPAPNPGASATGEADPPLVDPMQWWGALTQQFQTIATSTMRDMADHASKAAVQVAQAVEQTVEQGARRMAEEREAAQAQAPAPRAATAPAPAPRRAAAKTARATAQPVSPDAPAAKRPRASSPKPPRAR